DPFSSREILLRKLETLTLGERSVVGLPWHHHPWIKWKRRADSTKNSALPENERHASGRQVDGLPLADERKTTFPFVQCSIEISDCQPDGALQLLPEPLIVQGLFLDQHTPPKPPDRHQHDTCGKHEQSGQLSRPEKRIRDAHGCQTDEAPIMPRQG